MATISNQTHFMFGLALDDTFVLKQIPSTLCLLNVNTKAANALKKGKTIDKRT